MVSRLVLGCGAVAYAVIEAVQDDPGSLAVVCRDEDRVTDLREEGVDATVGDPADAELLLEVAPDADVVFVATELTARNATLVGTARECYPEAVLVASVGPDPDPDQRRAIAAGADHVVDPAGAVARRVLSVAASSEGLRTGRLRAALRRTPGPLAVVMHDNPDPDAIASALALCRIAEDVGLQADACYYGEISHQENRALVNLLDLNLRNLEPGTELSTYGGFALVDHSRPGVNDQLPPDLPIDVVIDHHPPRAPVEARFVDLRDSVGATSSLLSDYLQRLGTIPDRELATALLYGIRVDTSDFTREVSRADFEAAAFLQPHVDDDVLRQVEDPSVSVETLEVLARAIDNRHRSEDVLVTCVGRLSDRDALAQAAEQLLSMEDVRTTLVYGIMDGTIYVSARSRGAELDLGETLRAAFDRIGSAGGHADMAGAQLPLGVLGQIEEDDADLQSVVETVVEERFFDAVGDHRTAVGSGFVREATDLAFPRSDGDGPAR